MRLKRGLLVAPVLAVFLLAGCSVTVDQGELEESVSADLENAGQPVDSVECSDGLEGEVGFSTECTAHVGDNSHEIVVSVTEVDGTDVNYEIEDA